MPVTADHKGRIVGATPGDKYTRHTEPNGTITYTPVIPREYDTIRDVTEEEFEQFFGVPVHRVRATDIQVTTMQHREGYYHSGLVLTTFPVDERGNFIRDEDTLGRITERTLLRVKKPEEKDECLNTPIEESPEEK